MEPMRILARSSILRVLRRPKVAPVRRLSPSVRDLSPLLRLALAGGGRRLRDDMLRSFSYGSRNMASSSGATSEVLGKPDRRLLTPSAKDTIVPPDEHFAIPSAKDIIVPPDEDGGHGRDEPHASIVEPWTETVAQIRLGEQMGGDEDERRARVDIISGKEVASRTTVERTDGKQLNHNETPTNWDAATSCYPSHYINDDVDPLFTLPNSYHRDGSIYRGKDRWKTDYCIADRNETRFEAMALSVPTADCYIRNGFCMLHTPKAMLQIFSLKLAKIPVNGPVELYGYIATRDGLDPLLNYVVKFSRDDPIIMEQGSLISMAGPKRGIEMYNTVLIEYDMRIKTGKHEKDDLCIIDGVSLISNAGFSRKVFTNRINGNCGAVDIGVSRIDCAVEATVEVFISKVQSSFSLCLGCFTGGFKDEIRLFDGIIGEPRGLKRSVVAVMTRSSLDLKFKIGSGSHGCTEHCCSFKANNHGCVVQHVNTKFASVFVKVTWSTLPFTLAGLNLA
ncbi:hypothetical protein ACP70R_029604 [Stipagrostis hirtigluma subsp. patula]